MAQVYHVLIRFCLLSLSPSSSQVRPGINKQALLLPRPLRSLPCLHVARILQPLLLSSTRVELHSRYSSTNTPLWKKKLPPAENLKPSTISLYFRPEKYSKPITFHLDTSRRERTHLHVGNARGQVLVLRLSQVRVRETSHGVLDAFHLARHDGEHLQRRTARHEESKPQPPVSREERWR